MLAYSHKAIGSPKNTVLRPLQTRHSFDIRNEQPGFSKDTVILPKSVGVTKLGLEDMRTLSEAPYKTSALQLFQKPMFDNQQDGYDSQLQIVHSKFFELSDSSSQSESDSMDANN
ncbi:hypothetical protein F8M41_015179 [Gigaspora margarita]|uniref:Uncharacterized protein n=1 Tax=Gigaspora margarita TaxID=4874 RepID=A0A8H4ENM2_GIGMA|nr:hypothetical protein F8M41_015179 [Gigaspora margarita]